MKLSRLVLSLLVLALPKPLLAGPDPLEPLRSLAIQDGGRIKPFDTYARETARRVTGAKPFGFQRVLGYQPNTKAAVLIFGLFHGFGLATKLQDFSLSPNGLVANIVSFNVGVELGQVIALTGVLIVLSYWRTRAGFLRHAFVTNAVLMACGFLLVGYQLSGYFLGA